MADGAVSSDPRVQRQLDRLQWLSPAGDRLGLQRIDALLDRLGRPQDRLPPVLHVAGTNGKGSTCAVLRAAVEAGGGTAHVFTSPHLVRFNERIRIAGRLIEDDDLADALEAVLDVGADLQPSFFEVATVVAIRAFAATPATATILEVGLGGRLDATNIVATPAATGIAALGLDHQSFLGDTLAAIAGEKAGIAKRGVPLVTLAHPIEAAAVVERVAQDRGAVLLCQGRDWTIERTGDALRYSDGHGTLAIDPPALAGQHQVDNAGLAIAMLRHQTAVPVWDTALRRAPAQARWPARLQHVASGPLVDMLGRPFWIDGGHNPSAAAALADQFGGSRLHIILGMLETKDLAGFLAMLAPLRPTVAAVPIPRADHHSPALIRDLASGIGLDAQAHSSLAEALRAAPADRTVLVAGSLHLAGAALAENGSPPV
ncbi:dihydrofolate synthase/folylpolyglutamate synthase [Sphingomonas jejuensis]|uniref:Dihydrofolate synthase/folylpolyglutamate synthase n=1 Tax=Sphingomonas jejuensis TaxID=904715 RepID=A0ABX0XJR9_9SPHN|nr:folylpolyglutamate synthase/dihydrofolate synthase family protein [Sphingomonas jejuensis]NJC33584.1 dihydrofolate synthase/folylpolyglutamate synthase [Sphingomonas jejuensis]